MSGGGWPWSRGSASEASWLISRRDEGSAGWGSGSRWPARGAAAEQPSWWGRSPAASSQQSWWARSFSSQSPAADSWWPRGRAAEPTWQGWLAPAERTGYAAGWPNSSKKPSLALRQWLAPVGAAGGAIAVVALVVAGINSGLFHSGGSSQGRIQQPGLWDGPVPESAVAVLGKELDKSDLGGSHTKSLYTAAKKGGDAKLLHNDDDPLGQFRDRANEMMVNLGKDTVSKVEPFITFYAYRAAAGQGDDVLDNSVVMDLAATLTYLHLHVVQKSPRLRGIDRIKRWKVTVRTTREYFNHNQQEGRTFGWFWDFQDGKCVDEKCDAFFRHFGLIVGCGVAPMEDIEKVAYRSFPEVEEDNPALHWGLQWSLPGACPAQGKNADAQCKQSMPGGRCAAAVGAPDCAWSAEDAGEIMLDELAGIKDYKSFASSGGVEYDPDMDTGRKNKFWAGIGDSGKCDYRLKAAEKLFADNYPELAAYMAQPLCDSVGVPEGELAAPANHSGAMQPMKGFRW